MSSDANGGSPLVLVAEDDADILALVAYRLERSSYDVVTATDGEEALRLALERRPDRAVVDVMMPKLDGYDVTRALRERAETRGVPVMLLTARVGESDVARGREAGADDHLRKPFSPEELLERVSAALRSAAAV